ncbi:putative tRNA 4-demethylwyosine synthase [Maudiozyma barnettii]|uniref:S-adenosyl-L-methionine-dependent tRNA 4-demethylwyosine synthase n=1 Tax=Maudiozyma barnettii TaxID=61262 RepID=A0A8H2VH56_9SACH|nr:putative tRNA 4-demethylwyosine synthase [Kazachstania barnettii]CAB4255351.1 similar to Saccharomyces cerevisiae YPL207W TYW1 Protein required for the synthesis of wybutosine [Kazachstania barnettii]
MDLQSKVYVALGLASPIYLYFGGRLSILVVIWTSVVLFGKEIFGNGGEVPVEPHKCKCSDKNGDGKTHNHNHEKKEECCGGKGTGVNGKPCCGKGGKAPTAELPKFKKEPIVSKDDQKPKTKCCGGKGHDVKKHGEVCCGGKGHANEKKVEPVEKKKPKTKCCGGKGHDVEKHGKVCCGGKGHDDDKKEVAPTPEPIVEKQETKCCGGKGHDVKKNGKVCCGGKGHDKEKNVEIQEELKKEDNWDSLTVDFTEAFKSPNAKATKKSVKVFSKKGMTEVKATQTDNDADGLIKSAFTVSNIDLLDSDIYIFYSSLQGSSSKAGSIVQEKLREVSGLQRQPILLNLDEINDLDEYFVNVPSEKALYVMVVPSYDVDCPLDYFIQTLEENFNDHRLDKFPLRKLVGYTVLGLGDSESWPDKFCYQATKVDYWISHLGGRRIFPIGKVCMKYNGNDKIVEWANLLGDLLKDNEPILYEYDETVDNSDDDYDDNDSFDGSNDEEEGSDRDIDLEDVGGKDSNGGTRKINKNSLEVKQMIAKDSPTYKNLTKQGYKIVGSHSGVKICRWTKNELRGKGSCYKKSLFNIASSRCMELTPSLACSSKCVFCWRHGTNPVSKNWRWETDEPDFILENALAAHYSMIKQMRGVPGVIAERFINAFKVAHCALSLVGEPILYPYISKFIELLHEKKITSFLVCNAQHPESLRTIGRVTQLYVSIDASTKEELKKVDRPLYKDFWERMMECLDILRTVQSHQRTVFRLTLVKGFNMGEISSYADLVQRGEPCFIEVKGATFSGSSKDNVNSLTMQNIPYIEECKAFVERFVGELQRRGMEYEIAAEHAHSNCVLIAHRKFKIENKWHTHIDFEKFFQLLATGEPFTYMDYLQETPEWALYGNGGFAPGNVRVYRNEKKTSKNGEADDNRVHPDDLPALPVMQV